MVKYPTFNNAWGLAHGPISHFSLALPQNTAVQLFDSSNADRTPAPSVKTVTLNNPPSSGETVYIGLSNVTADSFWIMVSPGLSKSVDINVNGLEKLYAFTPGLGVKLSVAQSG